MIFATEKEACEAWVEGFNAIPQDIIEKLMRAYYDNGIGDEIVEITPPSLYDRVYIYDDEWRGMHGEIIQTKYDGEDDLYMVRLDTPDDEGNREVVIASDSFEVERDNVLPMWGTMWAFGEHIDNDWLGGEFCENHFQEMADCGFRIYEQEDYGYIFGIDGAGYDFYESHWIPLYRARGLHWHREEPIAINAKAVKLNDDCTATIDAEFNRIPIEIKLNSADVCKLYFDRDDAFSREDVENEIEYIIDTEPMTDEEIKYLREHVDIICSLYDDIRSEDASWHADLNYAIREVLSAMDNENNP